MILERIIRRLKNNPDYRWESTYSTRDLLCVTGVRLCQLIRGFVAKLFFKRSRGMLFVGKNVNLRHKYQMSFGANCIIDDNVYINALSHEGIRLGDNVSIGRNSTLICTGVIAQKGQGIIIGDGCGITIGVYLGGQGGIRIGRNVIIGPKTKIFSENHNFSSPDITIKDQGVTRKGVCIEDNCWIGGGVIILDGVTIGRGSVIAAGSVITKSVPEDSLIAGVPGRIIRNRTETI
jgi:acetyltransferase-like isoleucine patch superfamily enzyme